MSQMVMRTDNNSIVQFTPQKSKVRVVFNRPMRRARLIAPPIDSRTPTTFLGSTTRVHGTARPSLNPPSKLRYNLPSCLSVTRRRALPVATRLGGLTFFADMADAQQEPTESEKGMILSSLLWNAGNSTKQFYLRTI